MAPSISTVTVKVARTPCGVGSAEVTVDVARMREPGGHRLEEPHAVEPVVDHQPGPADLDQPVGERGDQGEREVPVRDGRAERALRQP